MAAKFGDAGDFLARAFFSKPNVNNAIGVQYMEDGKPKVYKRRWAILVAFCLGYFTWNFHSFRTAPLATEYALFYNQPNELQGPPDLGVDFLLIFDSVLLVPFYPIAGILVDTYGTKTMVFGAIGQALGCWWWYLSFTSYYSVVFSKVIANFSGACIATTLLRISNNWFAEDQRALAVAAGAIFASFGAGAVLVIAPAFSTGPAEINLDIISCVQEDLANIDIADAIEKGECPDEAQEAFCCAAPTDLDGLNLFLALWATVVAVYTLMVTRDAPPTPPSKSGIVRSGPPFKKAIQMMFAERNYTLICLTDFLSSGPPILLFSTVDRIFPSTVSEYANLASSIAFVLAIPVGAYFSLKLAQTKKFYEMTAAGYTTGFLAWAFVTLMVVIGTPAADVMVLLVGAVAILCYVMWTVSVYELKLEYIFSPEFALQGYVVAVDRTIINFSAVVFISAIPPERYKGDAMSGRDFSFVVGAVFMFIGMVIALNLPNKRDYRRMAFEDETGQTMGEILDENIVYSNPPEDKVRSLIESRAENKKESKFKSIFFSSKKDDDELEGKITHHTL